MEFRALATVMLVAVAALSAAFVANWEDLSPFPTVEAETTEETTIRISAKRLPSERTEFGLQVQSAGEWAAQRELPPLRRLSSDVDVDRWYRSSSIELESGHVVRIVARLLESGQIEVGLHEILEGEDGERILPYTRLFPRSPTVDQWLNTSPLVLANLNPKPPHTPLVDSSGTVGPGLSLPPLTTTKVYTPGCAAVPM